MPSFAPTLRVLCASALVCGLAVPLAAQDEPRSLDLGWRYAKGDRIRLERIGETTTKMTMAFNGMQAPPQNEVSRQRQIGTLTVTDVRADGSAVISGRFEHFEQSSDGAQGTSMTAKRGADDEWIVEVDASKMGAPDAVAMMTPMLESFIRNLAETTFTGTLAVDGTVSQVTATGDLFAGVPPMMQTMLAQGIGIESSQDIAEGYFQTHFPRLPGEAVAPGTKWKVAEALSVGSMRMEQVGEAELVARTDGPHVTEEITYPNALEAMGEVMVSMGEMAGAFFEIGETTAETSKAVGLSVVDADTGTLKSRHVQGKIVKGTMALTVSAGGGAPVDGNADIEIDIDETVTYKLLPAAPTTPSESE